MTKRYHFDTKKDGFLTTVQAAKILNISLSTLKKLIFQGRIKTFKTPGGHHRILVSDLLNAHKLDAPVQESDSSPDGQLYEAIYAFTAIIESQCHFAQGHAASVAKISRQIAQGLHLTDPQIDRVVRAALLHDIGMITVSPTIVKKQEPLTTKEYRFVQKHPQIGGNILGKFTLFADVVDIVKQHHEQPNGLGYPDGLKGNDICIEAKIISLAESFDCMTAPYSYKKPMSFERAVDLIHEQAASQFDPGVVKAFSRRTNVIRKEMEPV
jgi:excisionase family DNA binding protein/putative nucleotidyltransferase with HDIG domain